MTCPFCAIITGDAPAVVVREWPDALAIVPLNPVVAGHLLVISRVHVPDAATDPEVTAVTSRRWAELARDHGQSCNLISSIGDPATQTVEHLHLHLVPRAPHDGVTLPWTPQQSTR